jgi:diguanylate cyclase (GGDEF)-like protein
MHFSLKQLRIGIRAKLYCAAFLSTISVAALAVSSFHFASVTDLAAERLSHDGFEGVESSAQLQSLLEQHRRIVESAPAEVDRKVIESSQRMMIEKSSQLSALISKLLIRNTEPQVDAIEVEFSSKMPELIERAQEVLFYAQNFAQDKAIASATSYARVADDFEYLIRDYRGRRMAMADQALFSLSQSARSLIFWVSLSALAAIILIGPIGLTITRGILSRLDRITRFMTRLARHEIASEEVPSRGDHDEVGDMARAVQVFKENDLELLKRKGQLEQANLHLDVALNNMTHGLCMFDSQQRLIICNGQYAAMYNLPPNLTAAGTRLREILNYRRNSGNLSQKPDETANEISYLQENERSHSIRELPDGRAIAISRQTMADGGWVAIHEDITDRKRAEARITHLARHDQLTNLPNRAYFREELDEAIKRLNGGRKFSVLCLDLDRFKGVNDSLGHSVGDMLLKIVGDRLRECLQARDFVARLGGDEFAIIQVSTTRIEDCSNLARRIIDAISEPYLINGQQIIVGASIGISIAPVDGTDPDQLLKNADLAMYRAKAEGRGAYRLYEPGMDALIQARRSLEIDLRHALAANQLQLYYQPLVDTKRGTVTGLEALLRWFHPEHGEIPPSEFIPLAEETGLITPLGEWIFRSACAEATKWPHDIRVAVNLSSVQVKHGNLMQIILSALAASGLPASRLEIEITESILLENDSKTLAMLHQLRSLGVRIAMDDFGTGYSSLNYLRSFPLDKIKIDRSFVHDLSTKPEARAIIRAITDLARALRIGVVAEGVEDAEQLAIVQAEGCTEIQGYFFSDPRPASEVPDIIARCDRLMRIAA